MTTQRESCLRCFVLLIALLISSFAWAQSPQPAANPDLDLVASGDVQAMSSTPDGGLIVGGRFTSVQGTPRVSLARFGPDGTLDVQWSPAINGLVHAIAVDASGDVYVGGEFGGVDGQLRANLAKIDGATGQLDAQWNPDAGQRVTALVIDTAGRVIVGGAFRTIAGTNREYLVRLSASTGQVDLGWDPMPTGNIRTIAKDASGRIYVGGQFPSISGQPLRRIARFASDTGALDTTWRPDADGTVSTLAIAADGSVYAGGGFYEIGGQPRRFLAKLSAEATGAADPLWNPSPDNGVRALAVDSAGAVYAGGIFGHIGGESRPYVARLSGNGPGVAATDWNITADNVVQALMIRGNDLVIGGTFSKLSQQTRLGVATLSLAGGSVGESQDIEVPGYVAALESAPDGGVFVGGSFAKAAGLPRHNLLRLDAAGELDPTWAPSTDSGVLSMALDPEGFMYIGGAFSRVNDQPRTRLAKLSMSGSGSVDTDWVAAADDAVYAIDIDSTGAVYAGGYFTAINGQERLRVAKLSGVDGTLDPLWNPAANSYVMALAVDGDSIFVGGYFTSTIQSPSIGGQDREGIAKLSLTGTGAADPDWSSTMRDVNTITLGPNGTLFAGGSGMRSRLKISTTGFGAIDEAWMASVPGSTTDRIRAIAYDGRESVYLGGLFVLPDNTLPRRLARVAAGGAGTVDDQWNPMPNSDGIEGFNAAAGYYVLAVDPRGTLFVGGLFTTIGGLPRVALAAFPEAVFADGFETPE